MKLDLLDSSGWLECLEDGSNTVHFRPILLALPTLLIPTIVITEVRKVALKQRTLEKADKVTQAMRSGIVVPIDEKSPFPPPITSSATSFLSLIP